MRPPICFADDFSSAIFIDCRFDIFFSFSLFSPTSSNSFSYLMFFSIIEFSEVQYLGIIQYNRWGKVKWWHKTNMTNIEFYFKPKNDQTSTPTMKKWHPNKIPTKKYTHTQTHQTVEIANKHTNRFVYICWNYHVY